MSPGQHEEDMPPSEHGDDASSQPRQGGDTPPHDDTTDSASAHSAQDTSPAPVRKPKSKLAGQDFQWMKKHEDWLTNNEFTEALAKVKFFDKFVQTKAPDAYPYIKAMGEAKSSKNFVGWISKESVTVDKQLTDIQSQAEQAWEQSDEKHRLEQQQQNQAGRPVQMTA